MKTLRFFLFLVAAVAAWCPASFAQQACIAGCNLSPLGVTNGVTMTAGGTLTVGTVGGPEMDVFTNNSSAGLITNSALFAITTNASSTQSIVFNSSSNVFGVVAGTTGQIFLNISGGNAGTVVNLNGAVSATTTFVTGTGTVNFNSGSTNSTAMIFNADGAIGLAPNTTVNGALTTTAGAQTGTLSLGSGSVLNGAVGGAVGLRSINVVGGSNLAGVSATISGAADAFGFSLGTNTLNVGGALTIANGGAGGVINTTLASTSLYGNIRPVGATNLGPTLGINVTVPSTTFIPVGSIFNIVQTQTGTTQSGTNGSVLHVTVQNPTNPLYTFIAVPVAGTVAGLVAIETTGIPLQVALQPGQPVPPGVTIAAPVANALLNATPSPDLISVLAAINALSNPAAVVNALAQFAPSTPALAAPLVTFQGSRMFQDLYESRMDDVLCGEVNQRDRTDYTGSDPSTCRGNDPHNGWWMKGFGQFGSQGAQGAFPGYESQIFGTMAGFDVPIGDAPVGEATRAGFGLGYAHTAIDGKMFSANTDFDTAQVTGYIGHEQGPWFVQGNLSFGWNEYNGTRNISFPGFFRSAQSDYSGQDYTSYMSAGYHVFAGRYTVTPLASLQYTHVSLDNYTETGAGAVDLNVRSQQYDFLESGLGVKVSRPFGFWQGFANPDGTYVPEAHFKWLHEIYNPTLQNSASFTVGSPVFSTPGLKTADDTLNVGAGITFLSCACSAKTWALEAVYDFDWRTDSYAAQQVMLKFSARF